MRWSIYLVLNGLTRQPIYCGQTQNSLAARLAEVKYEWKKKKDGHRKHLAITGVYAMGGRLDIMEIDHAHSQAEADQLERAHIDSLRKRGYCWGNTAEGGPGNHGVKRNKANRRKIARSVRAYRRRRRYILNLFSSPHFILHP